MMTVPAYAHQHRFYYNLGRDTRLPIIDLCMGFYYIRTTVSDSSNLYLRNYLDKRIGKLIKRMGRKYVLPRGR